MPTASQACATLQASQDADAHGAQREAALAELARYEESGDGHLQLDSFWVSRTWLTCAPGHHPPHHLGCRMGLEESQDSLSGNKTSQDDCCT